MKRKKKFSYHENMNDFFTYKDISQDGYGKPTVMGRVYWDVTLNRDIQVKVTKVSTYCDRKLDDIEVLPTGTDITYLNVSISFDLKTGNCSKRVIRGEIPCYCFQVVDCNYVKPKSAIEN